MQVAARIAAGETLYRDVLWGYGPLPVYILSALYRVLGVQVATFSVMSQALGILACLLTYRAARFILPMHLALLSTMTVFLGGSAWQTGGFLSYMQSYTGAVPLGAVLGTLFVICLLYFLTCKRLLWLVAAGVATAGCCLTKPEFALASAGTGLFFLIGIVLFPKGFAVSRLFGTRALALFGATVCTFTGIAYWGIARHAGWHNVWAGIMGYGISTVSLPAFSPWGSLESWRDIFQGMGAYLLVAIAYAGFLASATLRKRMLQLYILIVVGLVLILLLSESRLLYAPPLLLEQTTPTLLALINTGIRIIWAPGTLIITVVIIVTGIRWFRIYKRREAIGQSEQLCGALAVYTALVAARFYFNRTWLPQYMDTMFPVFIFLAVTIPQVVERRGWIRLQQSQAHVFLVVILFTYVIIGWAVGARSLSSLDQKVTTPRGTMITNNIASIEVLRYILAHTEPEDEIVQLGSDSGFYFLSGRKNPLRQDYIIPRLGSSSADVEEILQRLATSRPKLAIVPLWAYENNLQPWIPADVKQEYSDNMQPIWQYVRSNFEMQSVMQGYVVYQ